MLTRICLVALACSTLLVEGCGDRAEAEKQATQDPPSAKKDAAAGGARSVTLHVEGMAQRLGIF